MSDAIEELEYKGYKIEIVPDNDPLDPRKEWDNLGTMLTSHGRYSLGDEQFKASEYESWEDVRRHLAEDEGAVIVLPLYLYDHSGLRMKVGSFQGLLPQGHAEFDSGMVGFIYVTKEQLKKEYGVKKITKSVIEKATKVLEGEVDTYDDYLSGNVVGWRVLDKDGEVLDSVWGYYGETKYPISEAKSSIDYKIKHDREERAKQRGEFKQAWKGYPEEFTEPHKKVKEIDYWEE